jgi:hypothetical protein
LLTDRETSAGVGAEWSAMFELRFPPLRRDAASKTLTLHRFTLRSLLPNRARTVDTPSPLFSPSVPLTVTRPDEPADIFYENLAVTALERFARRAGISVLRYFVVGASFVLTSVAAAAKHTAKVSTDCVACGIFDTGGALVAVAEDVKSAFNDCETLGAAPCCGPVC